MKSLDKIKEEFDEKFGYVVYSGNVDLEANPDIVEWIETKLIEAKQAGREELANEMKPKIDKLENRWKRFQEELQSKSE